MEYRECTINAIPYPVLDWKVVQVGEELVEHWNDWSLGLGENNTTTGRGYFYGSDASLSIGSLDTTTPNMLRVSPEVSTVTVTGATATQGYFFESKSGSTKFIYFCQAATIYKLNFSTGAVVGTNKVLASGTAGKPTRYNGRWYVPFGSGAPAASSILRLDTVHATLGANDDTWTAFDPDIGGAKDAEQMGTFQISGVPYLVTSYSSNLIGSVSSTGNVGSADLWTALGTVGDSSTIITDLVEAQGYLFVAKEDNLYEFDTDGNSRPVIPFLLRDNVDTDNGRGSHAFGDIVFYPCNQGLWRYKINVGALPVGPDSIRGFNVATGLTPPIRQRHRGVTSVGEWVYAVYGRQMIAGRGRRAGDPAGNELIWYDPITIYSESTTSSLFADSARKLWSQGGSANTIYRIAPVGTDGHPSGSTARGEISQSYEVTLDDRDFNRPYDRKQLLMAFVETDNWPVGGNQSLLLRGFIDSSSSVIGIGAAIDAGGVTARHWTLGTDDTCFRFRPRFRFTTEATWSNASDPRIRKLTIVARSPDIIEVTIPLDSALLENYGVDPETAEDRLRRLQNAGVSGSTVAGTVAVAEPGTEPGTVKTSTFNAQVLSVTDTRAETEQGVAYALKVTLRRWVTD